MWRIMIVMGLVMAMMTAAGGMYFKWSMDKFADMNTEMGVMQAEVAGAKATIELMDGRLVAIDGLNADYNEHVNIIRSETDALKNEVTGNDRAAQIAIDPRAAESSLNARINARFRELETITGGSNE